MYLSLVGKVVTNLFNKPGDALGLVKKKKKKKKTDLTAICGKSKWAVQ